VIDLPWEIEALTLASDLVSEASADLTEAGATIDGIEGIVEKWTALAGGGYRPLSSTFFLVSSSLPFEGKPAMSAGAVQIVAACMVVGLYSHWAAQPESEPKYQGKYWFYLTRFGALMREARAHRKGKAIPAALVEVERQRVIQCTLAGAESAIQSRRAKKPRNRKQSPWAGRVFVKAVREASKKRHGANAWDWLETDAEFSSFDIVKTDAECVCYRHQHGTERRLKKENFLRYWNEKNKHG